MDFRERCNAASAESKCGCSPMRYAQPCRYNLPWFVSFWYCAGHFNALNVHCWNAMSKGGQLPAEWPLAFLGLGALKFCLRCQAGCSLRPWMRSCITKEERQSTPQLPLLSSSPSMACSSCTYSISTAKLNGMAIRAFLGLACGTAASAVRNL